MKITSVRKRNTTRTKKNRGNTKPKIRWNLLGLSDPNLAELTIPIELIRREVSSLASRGLGRDSILRSSAQEGKDRGRQHRGNQGRRRGAAE